MIIVNVLDGADYGSMLDLARRRGLKILHEVPEFGVFVCEGDIRLLNCIPGISVRYSEEMYGF